MGTTLGDYILKLQFGVESLPYSLRYTRESPLTMTQKRRRPRTMSMPQQQYGMGKTTGMVAGELEKKYGIMEVFYNMEENFIVDNFESAIANGMVQGIMGGSWDYDWNATPLESKFRKAITGRKFDGITPRTPTKAAIRGVSHLRADPYRPSASRPSFMDTSLYMCSFKAWTEK